MKNLGRIILPVWFVVACVALPTWAYGQAPNVLLIVTDDQRSDTLGVMPNVRALANEGVVFDQSFVPTSLCSPSRASLLTGRYAHHVGVFSNLPPHGGAPVFDASTTMATALHDAGYTTGYFGKYQNAYDQVSPAIPPGWDDWHAFIDDLNLYFDYRLNENGVEVPYGNTPPDYSTDVLRDEVLGFITTHAAAPWFAVYAPAAPHSPATPAPRHAGTFAGIRPWRPTSYEEADVSDKPPFWSQLKQTWPSTGLGAAIDQLRPNQLETLLAVDEAVAAFMAALEISGAADRTIVIYTSDNGSMWGEHWMDGKRTGYEESLRVPLVVRDPQALRYREKRRLVLNLDLAPTIAELTGATLTNVDGQSLVPLLHAPRRNRKGVPWRSDFLTEAWLFPDDPSVTTQPPTYAGVRTERWKYLRTETSSGTFEEIYDLHRDRAEMNGTVRTAVEAAEVDALRTRLLELQQ